MKNALTRIQLQQEEKILGNTYDSVPPITPNTDHLYANTQVIFKAGFRTFSGVRYQRYKGNYLWVKNSQSRGKYLFFFPKNGEDQILRWQPCFLSFALVPCLDLKQKYI